MSDTPKQMDGQDWTYLVLLSLLWGAAFFFAGVAVRELPPMTVVLVRVALAALVLLPLFWAMGHRLPRGFAAWLPFLGMGLFNNVLPFSLIFAGQTYVSVGLSAIINALTPLFAVLVMAAAAEERLTWNRVTGVLLGVIGVAILRGIDAGPDAVDQTIGIALCGAGAFAYGLAALWGRRRLGGVAPLKSATCQLISSSAMMAVLVAVWDRPWNLPMPGADTWAAMAALAVFGTALAYLVFFRIMVRAGASNVMLVTLLIPVSAMVLGNMFLDEQIRAQDVGGAVVIAAGLLFIDGRAVAWARRTLGLQPKWRK